MRPILLFLMTVVWSVPAWAGNDYLIILDPKAFLANAEADKARDAARMAQFRASVIARVRQAQMLAQAKEQKARAARSAAGIVKPRMKMTGGIPPEVGIDKSRTFKGPRKFGRG